MSTQEAVTRTSLGEGARFAVIGLTSTAITIVVFNLLVHRGDPPALADHPIEGYLLGMVVGTAWSFVGNRWWVFQAAGSLDWRRDLAVFVAINIAGAIIPSACLGLTRYVLDQQSVLADNISANVVGLLAATVFRFYAYKNLAFGSATA